MRPLTCPERSAHFSLALPHEWEARRSTSGRVVHSWCRWCREQRNDAFTEELLSLLWAVPREELFSPAVNEAVDAFLAGKQHPLIDQLREEIQGET